MKHTRETINGKLRAYNAGKGTLQEFVDEVAAYFKELEQGKCTGKCFGHDKAHELLCSKCRSINESLGVGSKPMKKGESKR